MPETEITKDGMKEIILTLVHVNSAMTLYKAIHGLIYLPLFCIIYRPSENLDKKSLLFTENEETPTVQNSKSYI